MSLDRIEITGYKSFLNLDLEFARPECIDWRERRGQE